MSESANHSQGMRSSTFIPLLVIALTLLLQISYRNSQLQREGDMLSTQWDQQTTPIEEANRLRNQLQAIAGATAVLADQGNENAIQIRERLGEQGITIQPPR
jgi:hypothetical protein